MASEPLVQGPLFGAPASRLAFDQREFVKTPTPSPESSPEKEEANRVEHDLASLGISGGCRQSSPEKKEEEEEAKRVAALIALVMSGKKDGCPGFTCKLMAEGARPCRTSRETGKKCARRLEQVDREIVDCFMTRQPAPPVLPSIASRPKLDQRHLACIQAVQDMRDFEWDILTQFSTQNFALAWLCDCDDEDEDEEVVV